MEKKFFSKEPSVLYENRFCYQENFDIIITGLYDDKDYSKGIFKVKSPNLTHFESLVSNSKYIEESLTFGSSIMIICNQETKKQSFDDLKMCSSSYDLSNNLVQLPDTRYNYCVCSFMKNHYVIGGIVKFQRERTCLRYTTRNSKWENISNLCNARSCAACTVFEGKIVVSGGASDNWKGSNSVETYDHHDDKWTCLPDRIEERYNHGSVGMGNKMFVIGGSYCTTVEVFDNVSRKFTHIKQDELKFTVKLSVLGIGNQIFAFPKYYNSKIKRFYIFDFLNDQWCVKEIELPEIEYVISCSKLPVVR